MLRSLLSTILARFAGDELEEDRLKSAPKADMMMGFESIGCARALKFLYE
jgi:hypothetical protein